MPSPFGEGQTDKPINHIHLGEVPNPTPTLPKWGGSQLLLKRNFDLKTQHAISTEKDSSPCPLHLERGKPTCRLIMSIWVRSQQTPLPSPPRGRSQNLPETEFDLETQYAISAEKKSTPYHLHLERGKRTRRSITPIRVRFFCHPHTLTEHLQKHKSFKRAVVHL